MAIKEDLNEIKKEIGAQEQFLESVIKGERFFNKNKKLLIVLLVIVVIALIALYANKIIDNRKVVAANEAYSKLIMDANDTKAAKILKQNEPSVYALYELKAALEKGDIKAAKELANLPVDPLVKQIILSQTTDQSTQILASYDALLQGFEYLKQNKISEANAEFAKIPLDSQLMTLVKNLQHYQGNK
ncbi:hypothetical protein [Campylobacter curvus]|uniref:Tetratricopeptide repeat-like domain-containing protein n=1 Tax=Campylobacter curvus (strain 525.92) TaxID=360105 RepID=A7GX42_CAMC5|nr:hypothetical protein [Campylobacter curvus]EAT99848.1 hypothetical protein CCV52592_0996 [Campylobacter curvus 525.92]